MKDEVPDLIKKEAQRLKEIGVDKYIKTITDETVARLSLFGDILMNRTDVEKEPLALFMDQYYSVIVHVMEELLQSLIDKVVITDDEITKKAIFTNVCYLIASKMTVMYMRVIGENMEKIDEQKDRSKWDTGGYI